MVAGARGSSAPRVTHAGFPHPAVRGKRTSNRGGLPGKLSVKENTLDKGKEKLEDIKALVNQILQQLPSAHLSPAVAAAGACRTLSGDRLGGEENPNTGQSRIA